MTGMTKKTIELVGGPRDGAIYEVQSNCTYLEIPVLADIQSLLNESIDYALEPIRYSTITYSPKTETDMKLGRWTLDIPRKS